MPPNADGGAARVVLVTAPDLAVARDLARKLVEGRLAACVNLVPGLTSVYRWRDAVEEEAEVLLLIKTTADRLHEIERCLLVHHPYAVPECVALEPARVEERYLAWLTAAAHPAPEGE
jgi:periplasmic divalent cation tolerance protein